jgi:chaperonin GroES
VNNPLGIQPIEYKVLVKVDEVQPGEEKYKGIIIIPDTANTVHQRTGTLVAIGGKSFEDFGSPSPQIGDKVLFNRYAGVEVKNSKDRVEDWRILNDKDINAILNEEVC